jgi:hypothetical protein
MSMAEANQTAQQQSTTTPLPKPGEVQPLPRVVLNNEKKSLDKSPQTLGRALRRMRGDA